MRAQDLESQVNLLESKQAYDDTLDVIKLPLPIPAEERSDAPQFYSFVKMNMPYSSALDNTKSVF